MSIPCIMKTINGYLLLFSLIILFVFSIITNTIIILGRKESSESQTKADKKFIEWYRKQPKDNSNWYDDSWRNAGGPLG